MRRYVVSAPTVASAWPLTRQMQMTRTAAIALYIAGLTLLSLAAHAQGMMDGFCPMCGMGWGGMVLSGLLVLSLIAALIALTIYFIRRSKGPRLR